MRRLTVVLCIGALLGASACGGDDSGDARKAAQGYVSALGKRNGTGTCALMTKDRQRAFDRIEAWVGLEPSQAQMTILPSGAVMQAALDTIQPDQLRQFGKAKIDNLKLDGDKGTFRYTLGTIQVDGRVAKEDGDWRVSCCVPGSG